jgi:hypothetical protein
MRIGCHRPLSREPPRLLPYSKRLTWFVERYFLFLRIRKDILPLRFFRATLRARRMASDFSRFDCLDGFS